MTEFLFGDQRTLALIGWHLAVFISIYIGWSLSHYHYHYHYIPKRRKRRKST